MVNETLNRDEVRTPMQWNDKKNAGFSSADKTWLPVHENFRTVNVAAEEKDENSMLGFIKNLLQLRNNHLALQNGKLELIPSKDLPENVLGYKRNNEKESLVVYINFSNRKKEIKIENGTGKIILATQETQPEIQNNILILDKLSGVVILY